MLAEVFVRLGARGRIEQHQVFTAPAPVLQHVPISAKIERGWNCKMGHSDAWRSDRLMVLKSAAAGCAAAGWTHSVRRVCVLLGAVVGACGAWVLDGV